MARLTDGGWGTIDKCDACGEIMQVIIGGFNVIVFTHESGLLYSGCTQCRHDGLAAMEREEIEGEREAIERRYSY